MILRQTAFYFLIVSFWFVLLFISIPASAEEIEYAHAIVTTSAGKEIPVEVADTIKKTKPWTWKEISTEKKDGECCLSSKNEKCSDFG